MTGESFLLLQIARNVASFFFFSSSFPFSFRLFSVHGSSPRSLVDKDQKPALLKKGREPAEQHLRPRRVGKLLVVGPGRRLKVRVRLEAHKARHVREHNLHHAVVRRRVGELGVVGDLPQEKGGLLGRMGLAKKGT